jgi:hypothetical protein
MSVEESSMRKSALVGSWVVIVLAGLLCAQAGTKTTGEIRGLVLDEKGGLVQDAAISARNLQTNLVRDVVSSGQGEYILPLLPPGGYEVVCEVPGFARLTESQVTVAIGAVTRLDFHLTAAMSDQTVEVSATVANVEPGRTQNSTLIDEEQIDNLPINQRNYLSYCLTTPGVNTDRLPQAGATPTSGLTFNGQSPRVNNIQVDGFDNNENAPGSVRSTFSQEAIQEFQVLDNNFSAEYGRAAGGIVNIVTKSGTNDWHGSAFFFWRGDSLDATNAFAPSGEDVPFSQKQFGGSVGGPIRKDKTFLFAAFERLAVSDHNIVTFDPAALAAINEVFPVEGGAVPYDIWSNQFFTKVDHHFNPEHSLSVRFNYADSKNENYEPWGGLKAKSRGGFLDLTDLALSASLNSIFSTSLLNEARFQYAWRDFDFGTFDPAGPTVEILGVATLGRDRLLPHTRKQNYYQFIDTLSWFSGKHSLKVGVDMLYVNYAVSTPFNFGGRYIFSALPANALYPGSPALSALQAFEQGLPAMFLQGFGDPNDRLANLLFSVFAQWDWHLRPNLVLKLGVRYDKEALPQPFPSDDNNLAPRVALSYGLNDGRTNLRAAAGRFYAATSVGTAFVFRQSMFGLTNTILLRGLQAVTAWNQPGHKFSEDPGLTPYPIRFQVPDDFKAAYSDQFSVGIDQALTSTLTLSCSFQVLQGHNFQNAVNINPIIDPATGQRPIPGYADVYSYQSTGSSWYKGMTLSVNKQMSRGTMFLFSYTLSKAEDDYIDLVTNVQPQDPLNQAGEKGPSLLDERHRVVFSGIWDLSGYTDNVILDNFQLSTIWTYGSGRPYNILAGYDRNGNGDATSDRPEGVGRNAGDGPDYFSVDLRISKRIPLPGEGNNLEFTIEAFNLFNRTNYSEVNPVYGPGPEPLSTFGQPTAAYPARQIQLGVHYYF